jgi:hypothetical protein
MLAFGDIRQGDSLQKDVGILAPRHGDPGSHPDRSSSIPRRGDRVPGIRGADDARRTWPAAGGWPKGFQAKVLKGSEPILVRPGSLLAPADLEAERANAQAKIG